MFVEDPALFFADYGRLVAIGGLSVRGILDNGHASGGAGMLGIATTQPQFRCATADIPAAPVNQPLTDGADSYVIVEHKPDGTGFSVLMLETAP